jgi:hypothetical protein
MSLDDESAHSSAAVIRGARLCGSVSNVGQRYG